MSLLTTFTERIRAGDDWQMIIIEELYQSRAGQPNELCEGMTDDEIMKFGRELISDAEAELD